MASITIRNLDGSLKSCLRIQAAVHGRSMEDEARDILRTSLNQEPPEPKNLRTAIHALFKPFGGFDLPKVPREPMREPPTSQADAQIAAIARSRGAVIATRNAGFRGVRG
jgi:plasmid stability protein